MPLPKQDTICTCSHWYDEHDRGGACDSCHSNAENARENGYEAVEPCLRFTFDPAQSTPEAIADRGGDPALWPEHVKKAIPEWEGYVYV